MRSETATLCASLLSFLVVACTSQTQSPSDASSRPPNLIVIMTDDQAYRDWQAHDERIHTPNLMKLAREGFVLENYHAMVACSPTRAALLTGRYGQRTGVTGILNYSPRDRRFMRLEEVTVAEVLRAAGYSTALIGKWHLADRPGIVEHYGFDYFYGFLRGATRYQNPHNFFRNADPLGVFEGYATDLFADEAVAFIEQNQDRPFFLLVCPNAPHEPLVGAREDLAHYPEAQFSNKQRHYYATVTSVDRAVGRIRGALEALGLAEDSILVFTSDNGTGLRPRSKATLYARGSHVPFIVWAPNRIAPGRSSALVGVLDLFPTFVEWAGAAPPDGVVLDGLSLAPTLRGEGPPEEDRIKFRELGSNYSAFNRHHRLLLTNRHSGSLHAELFDLEKDPDESQNLLAAGRADAHPTYQRLKAAITEWQRETRGDPNWKLPRVAE